MRVGILHTAYIGDLALCGLLIEALHRAGHEITLLSNKGGLALYEHDARVADGRLLEKGKGFAKISSFRHAAETIARARLELLLVPHRSTTSALLARASGVPRAVGFAVGGLSFLYSEVRTYRAERHECLRILDLAPEDVVSAPLRAELEAHAAPLLRPGREPGALLARFPELAVAGARYFVVSPGSVWVTKRYPVEKLARLVELVLAEDASLRCVVSGGPTDAEAIDGFFAALTQGAQGPSTHACRARIHDARGVIPLGDLAAVLARAQFAVTNDSAPLHVACGVGTPVVGIFGPTSTRSGLGPSGAKARAVTHADAHGELLACQPCSPHGHERCPQGHFRCMRDLPPETVVKVLRELQGSLSSP